MDHTRIGELLATGWSLPPVLSDAIRFHHQPEKSTENRTLTTIVYLADLLMSRFHSGLELERMGTYKLIEHLSQLNLSSGQFKDLVDLMPQRVFEPVAESIENGDGPLPE